MPQAFTGDGTEGQRAEKVDEENFRYVKELSFAKRFKLPTVAPIIYGGFGVARSGRQPPARSRHPYTCRAVWRNSRAFAGEHLLAVPLRALPHSDRRTIPSVRNRARGKRLVPQGTPEHPLF